MHLAQWGDVDIMVDITEGHLHIFSYIHISWPAYIHPHTYDLQSCIMSHTERVPPSHTGIHPHMSTWTVTFHTCAYSLSLTFLSIYVYSHMTPPPIYPFFLFQQKWLSLGTGYPPGESTTTPQHSVVCCRSARGSMLGISIWFFRDWVYFQSPMAHSMTSTA